MYTIISVPDSEQNELIFADMVKIRKKFQGSMKRTTLRAVQLKDFTVRKYVVALSFRDTSALFTWETETEDTCAGTLELTWSTPNEMFVGTPQARWQNKDDKEGKWWPCSTSTINAYRNF